MKEITIIKKFITEECINQIESVTYPRIKKLDFKNAKKQYERNRNRNSPEYQDMIRFEKAYNAIIKLEDSMNKPKHRGKE